MSGFVQAICICPVAGDPMQEVQEVEAIAGKGLEGDRYMAGAGSFNKEQKKKWYMRLVGLIFKPKQKRQVTLINALFFEGSGFEYADSRRNIVTEGVELMWLVGREFQIGGARFRGIKYCDPCERPNKLAGKKKSFKEAFSDRGGLVAEIVQGGVIRVNDPIIPPPKGY